MRVDGTVYLRSGPILARYAVVLKGTMTNPFGDEENPPEMEPGSFWSVKAGEKHVTACVSETPCEFLMWGGEKFDFIAEE